MRLCRVHGALSIAAQSLDKIKPLNRGGDGSRVCDPRGSLGQSPNKRPCKRQILFVCDIPYKIGRPPRQSFEFAPASVDGNQIRLSVLASV